MNCKDSIDDSIIRDLRIRDTNFSLVLGCYIVNQRNRRDRINTIQKGETELLSCEAAFIDFYYRTPWSDHNTRYIYGEVDVGLELIHVHARRIYVSSI